MDEFFRLTETERELRDAASLTLRPTGDTLRHVSMRDGERIALEEVSERLRRALRVPGHDGGPVEKC